MQMLRLSEPTIIDWCNFLRELCHQENTSADGPPSLGGLYEDCDSFIVEIDESMFYRAKYNRGRSRRHGWVFGVVERESRRCRLIPVPNCKAETLLPIIQRWIRPESRIIWRLSGIRQHQHNRWKNLHPRRCQAQWKIRASPGPEYPHANYRRPVDARQKENETTKWHLQRTV